MPVCRRHSSVWDDFNAGKEARTCLRCGKEYALTTSTSTLRAHAQKCQDQANAPIISTLTPDQHKALQCNLIKWIVVGNISIDAVLTPWFAKLVHDVYPDYCFPAESELKEAIQQTRQKMYEQEQLSLPTATSLMNVSK